MFKVLLFVVVAAALTAAEMIHKSPVVKTRSGDIQGQLIKLSKAHQVYQFTGIPFAEPPTGTNRFKKPVKKERWEGVFDATKMSKTCPQIDSSTWGLLYGQFLDSNSPILQSLVPQGPQSEDCLQLNIWVPREVLDKQLDSSSSSEPRKLSVYTFIHGGAFADGGSTLEIYNGAVLAAYNDVIVVTIQYRLGTLGFAYWPEKGIPGNMGLWDQLEALKWIRKNIEEFGGDRHDITLAGQSAGAVSVTHHLISPYSRRFVQKAIIESGSALAAWGYRTSAVAKADTLATFDRVKAANCAAGTARLVCAQGVDPSAFPANDGSATLAMKMVGPVIDGDFIPREPLLSLSTGDFKKVPILIGANRGEGSIYASIFPVAAQKWLPYKPGHIEKKMLKKITATAYGELMSAGLTILNQVTNPIVAAALQHEYWPRRHEDYPSGREFVKAVVAAAGDAVISCPTYTWANLAASVEGMASKTFVYYFTQRNTAYPLPKWMGAFHGSELPFVFGEPFSERAKKYEYSKEEKELSRSMMAQWTNFAKYGTPNPRQEKKGKEEHSALGWPAQRPTPQCPLVQAVQLKAGEHGDDSGVLICGLKYEECNVNCVLEQLLHYHHYRTDDSTITLPTAAKSFSRNG